MNAIVPLRLRFSHTDRITLSGASYRLVETSKSGHVLVHVDNRDVVEEFSHEQIEELNARGDFQCEQNYFAAGRARTRDANDGIQLSALTPEEQWKIDHRAEYCKRFLILERSRKATRSDASMKAAATTIFGELLKLETARQPGNGRCDKKFETFRPPSPSTLRKWLKRYDECDGDRMALSSRYRRSGNRKRRLDPEILVLLVKYADEYKSLTKPTKRGLHNNMCAEIMELNKTRAAKEEPPLPMPSVKALERQIGKISLFDLAVGREGRESALRKFGILGEGVDVVRPLERVEIDEWNVSLQTLLTDTAVWSKLPPEQRELVRKSRTWLTAAIDAATRCILALHLSTDAPSATSAVAALRMVVTDKTKLAALAGAATSWDMYGLPETIVTDAGSGFISVAFRSAVSELGAESMLPPAGRPQMRGRIERVFGTIHTQLLSWFDGRTFENVVARGDYPAEARASLLVEELNRVLIRYVVDYYHNHPHEGLGSETPRRCWDRLVGKYGVKPPPSPDQKRHIFGIQAQRVIGNWGIRYLGLWFRSLPLNELRREIHGKFVEIRIDPDDVSRISVRRGDGWLTVQGRSAELKGVSVAEWIATGRELRRKYADQAMMDLPVVLAALHDIRRLGVASAERTGLGSPILTEEDCEKANRELFRHFGLTHELEEGPGIAAHLGLSQEVPEHEKPTTNQAEVKRPHHEVTKPNGFGKEDDWELEV